MKWIRRRSKEVRFWQRWWCSNVASKECACVLSLSHTKKNSRDFLSIGFLQKPNAFFRGTRQVSSFLVFNYLDYLLTFFYIYIYYYYYYILLRIERQEREWANERAIDWLIEWVRWVNEREREECKIEGPCGSVMDVTRENSFFVLTRGGKSTRYYSYTVTWSLLSKRCRVVECVTHSARIRSFRGLLILIYRLLLFLCNELQ